MSRVNLERKRILEFVQKLERESVRKEDPPTLLGEVEEGSRSPMAQDVNAALMDILGLLSEASHRLTSLMRGGAPVSLPREPASAFSEPAEETPSSSLDRIQEFEPGPKATADVVEEMPKRRGRRGKFNVSTEDLKKMYVDQGMTAKAIGEKYGVAHGTVAQRVMKLGLSKRGKREKKGKK